MSTDTETPERPTKHTVLVATPFAPMQLGSFGTAEYMLLRQFNFPYEYDEAKGDKHLHADSDRLSQWDFSHTRAAYRKRRGLRGDLGIADWARTASRAEIMAFLIDVMKAGENHPGVKWTGFRILGTVNRSNGYPVWTYELFAKGEGSDTKTYSRSNSPNCHPLGFRSTPEQRAAYKGRTGTLYDEDFGGYCYFPEWMEEERGPW